METHLRTWVRTLSYRFTALLITAFWTGLSDAVTIHFVLALMQYGMERVWLKVDWGKISNE
jgi:secreted protein with Ig-like and vWFA domain